MEELKAKVKTHKSQIITHEESLVMKDREIAELRSQVARSQNEQKLADKFIDQVQASFLDEKALSPPEDKVSELESLLETSRQECEGLKELLESIYEEKKAHDSKVYDKLHTFERKYLPKVEEVPQ